jgi:hypothetical protein
VIAKLQKPSAQTPTMAKIFLPLLVSNENQQKSLLVLCAAK